MSLAKRITAVFAALTLLLCLIPAARADAEPVLFSVSTAEGEPGSDVTVSLTISGTYAANALTLFMDYDSALLTRKGSLSRGPVWTEIISTGGTAMTSLNVPGSIGFLAIVPEGQFSSSGVLFSVTFHISEDAPGGMAPITLRVEQFTFDELDGTIIRLPFETEGGAVIISAPGPVGLPGDVDGDGVVTFTDISVLYGFLLGKNVLAPELLANADFDGDGTVTFNDVGTLYYFCLGGN